MKPAKIFQLIIWCKSVSLSQALSELLLADLTTQERNIKEMHQRQYEEFTQSFYRYNIYSTLTTLAQAATVTSA